MADDSVVVSTGVQENRENPFTANGPLSIKADYIISHSTITRTEVHIADPDADEKGAAGDQVEEVIVTNLVQSTESAAPGAIPSTVAAPVDAVPVEPIVEPIGTTPVEVEVSKGNAAPAQPQHAEEVKLKEKKNCCAIL